MLVYSPTDGGTGSLNECRKEAQHLLNVLADPAIWERYLAVPEMLAGQLQTEPHNATTATIRFDEAGLTITVKRVDEEEPSC